MRRAILKAVAVEVICPKCKEPKSEPESGSLMWETNQLQAGTILTCYTCQTIFQIGKVPSSLRVA